jgi:hypothetical protein
LLGREVSMAEVEDRLEVNFRDVFEYRITEKEIGPRNTRKSANEEVVMELL